MDKWVKFQDSRAVEARNVKFIIVESIFHSIFLARKSLTDDQRLADRPASPSSTTRFASQKDDVDNWLKTQTGESLPTLLYSDKRRRKMFVEGDGKVKRLDCSIDCIPGRS